MILAILGAFVLLGPQRRMVQIRQKESCLLPERSLPRCRRLAEASVKPLGENQLHRLRGRTLRTLGAPYCKCLHGFRDGAVGSIHAPFFDIVEPFSDATIHDRLGLEHDLALMALASSTSPIATPDLSPDSLQDHDLKSQ